MLDTVTTYPALENIPENKMLRFECTCDIKTYISASEKFFFWEDMLKSLIWCSYIVNCEWAYTCAPFTKDWNALTYTCLTIKPDVYDARVCESRGEFYAQMTLNWLLYLRMFHEWGPLPVNVMMMMMMTRVCFSRLDGRHVVFGSIKDGLDVVRKLEALGSRSEEPLRESASPTAENSSRVSARVQNHRRLHDHAP